MHIYILYCKAYELSEIVFPHTFEIPSNIINGYFERILQRMKLSREKISRNFFADFTTLFCMRLYCFSPRLIFIHIYIVWIKITTFFKRWVYIYIYINYIIHCKIKSDNHHVPKIVRVPRNKTNLKKIRIKIDK